MQSFRLYKQCSYTHQKLPNTVFDNAAAISHFCNLNYRSLQKIPDAVDQRIVVDDIGNFSSGNRQLIDNRNLLRFFQIWRAREADDGIYSIIFCPAGNDSTELDFVTDCVMDFINKDGQKGKFANQVAKFIGLPILFIIAFFEKTELSVFLLNTVEDDFSAFVTATRPKSSDKGW